MPYAKKEDQAASSKKHYENNKEVIKKRAKEFKKKALKRNQEFINSYLKINPCVDCGFSDIRALEFDHVKGKKYKNVSDLSRTGSSIKKIKEEISKCEVRCANCHRIKTDRTLWNTSK